MGDKIWMPTDKVCSRSRLASIEGYLAEAKHPESMTDAQVAEIKAAKEKLTESRTETVYKDV